MRGHRKRQIALTFTPLPSSSPQLSSCPKQIRDRAAAVRFSASPSPNKKRRLNDRNDVLPSPDPSSRQTTLISLESADELKPSISSPQSSLSRSRKRKKRRMKQKQIDFSQARDPSTFDPPISLRASSQLEPPQPSMFAPRTSSKRKRHYSPSLSSEDSGSGEEEQRTVTTRAHTTAQQDTQQSSAEDDDDLPKSSRQRRRKAIVILDEDEEDTEKGDASPEDADEDDDMPTTLGRQARRRQFRSSPFPEPSNSDDGDDDVVILKSSHRSAKGKGREDDDLSDVPATPRKKARLARRVLSQQEKDDLDDDLDFLAPESDDEPVSSHRSIQSAKKDARQAALAKLKAKRAGAEIPNVEEEDEDDDAAFDNVLLEQLPTSSKQMFRQIDEEDEAFIQSDDEDAPLGIPEGMPIEFTSYASMKAKDLFRYAVDWFVQRIVNPAFKRDDDLYKLSFQKLDDEVKGLAQSKFTSSAWTAKFITALNGRPDLAFRQFQSSVEDFRDRCDACNRSGHPATFEVEFHGHSYYPETLEEVSDPYADPDDSEDSDASATAGRSLYDAQGRELPPEGTIFYVGKFCMANAQAAHALQHWRYHLAELIDVWLTRQGYNSPEEIVKRDRMSTKKRRKLAHKIVDRMETSGKLKDLYRSFKARITDARIAKQSRFEIQLNSP